MNPIVKFFHELFNPHCEFCKAEKLQELEQHEIDREINGICQSCENLKMQLAVMNQLVDKLTNKPEPIELKQEEAPKNIIQTKHVPWNVRKQQLETASRLRAEQLRAEAGVKIPEPDKIEKLENELGIDNGTKPESTQAINS